jgi:hypothetical protein
VDQGELVGVVLVGGAHTVGVRDEVVTAVADPLCHGADVPGDAADVAL